VLEQTTRPLHAVAGAANEDVKRIKRNGASELLSIKPHASSLKAASRGIQNKDKTTFSDVLKTAGVKNKTIRSVGGFVADVGLDPTTYATFGTGTIARKAAVKASENATKKALSKGLTQDQAQRFGERAARQAAKTAPKAKGGRSSSPARKSRASRRPPPTPPVPSGQRAARSSPRRPVGVSAPSRPT
jgi:hypothetical protein